MDKNETRVVDLGEATALMTSKFELLRLEQAKRGPHKIFVFSTEPSDGSGKTIKDVVELYRRHRLQVDAYDFFLSGKEIKHRIHDDNDFGEGEE